MRRSCNFIYYMKGSVCVSVLFINRAATAKNCTGGARLRIACVLAYLGHRIYLSINKIFVLINASFGVLFSPRSHIRINLIQLMNISDKDGPLSTNIIIVLIADEIIKADQTA